MEVQEEEEEEDGLLIEIAAITVRMREVADRMGAHAS